MQAVLEQPNPWPTGTPEGREYAAVQARLVDPSLERRCARYLTDQTRTRPASQPGVGAPLVEGIAATGVLFGPDVSMFQGAVDWARVRAAGCGFAGYKVSEGASYRDPQHAANRAGVPAAGLVPVAYHYLAPTSPAAAQADWYCSLADPGAVHALDVEAPAAGLDVTGWVAAYRKHYPTRTLLIYSNRGMWLNRSHVTQPWPPGAEAWHAGYRDGLYTAATGGLTAEWAGTGALANSLASLGAPACRLWQFTDHAQVPGVAGGCDGNAWQGTLAELQDLAGQETDMLSDADVAKIWGYGIQRPWDGQNDTAAALLASAHFYAVQAGFPGTTPKTAGSTPGQPTTVSRLLAALTVVAGQTDTLEASEAAQGRQLAALAALTPDGLAEAIAAKLGGSADAAVVKAAVEDALAEKMPTFNIVAETPQAASGPSAL